jgi:hypothetical protein
LSGQDNVVSLDGGSYTAHPRVHRHAAADAAIRRSAAGSPSNRCHQLRVSQRTRSPDAPAAALSRQSTEATPLDTDENLAMMDAEAHTAVAHSYNFIAARRAAAMPRSRRWASDGDHAKAAPVRWRYAASSYAYTSSSSLRRHRRRHRVRHGPPFYIQWVKVEYSDGGSWYGPFTMSQVSPPTNPSQWEAVLTGLDFKPTLFSISYGAASHGANTRGIRRIDVEYCCQ